MSFIIDPSSINHTSIRTDIENWLNSKPDAEKWAVFFQSSAGQSLIDLIAGLTAFYQYESIVARRESFIAYAQNRSSILGGAQFLGYSAYRGKNAVVKLTITPATSGVWSKWDVIGVVKDRYLIVAEDTVKNAGVPVNVNCIIGEVLSETVTSPSDRLNSFRFTKPLVSEDCRIYIDSVEVDWGSNVSDLLDGKFVLQSNPLGSVDAKYLNLPGFTATYIANSSIMLKWISLKDVDFALTDISLDDGEGTLDDKSVVSIFADKEDVISIKVNAPLKNETQNAVRGRRDQAKVFKQIVTNCLDAKGYDLSAAVVQIFYVLANDIRLSQTEKDAIQEAFEPYRPHGWLPPLISDATRNLVKLKIDINLTPKKSGNTTSTIDSILSTKQYILGDTLSLYGIEEELEATDFIRIARVSLTGDNWASDTMYEIGTLVKKFPDNGKIYKAIRIRYFSGTTEPVWPIVTDDLITDGQIIWKAVPKLDPSAQAVWTANTDYLFNASVRPSVANGFIYTVVGFVNKSGSVEPTWPIRNGGTADSLLGEKINDNQIVWVARPLVGTVSAWSANTTYKTGDLVVATNPVSSDTVDVMFQAYAYRGQSGSITPTYPTTNDITFLDGSLQWQTLDPEADSVLLNDNEYFVLDYVVTVS